MLILQNEQNRQMNLNMISDTKKSTPFSEQVIKVDLSRAMQA